jgi:hypothetical protein
MMVSRAPPAVAPPPVLRPDWKILAWLAFTRIRSLDLNVCPTSSHPPVGFVAQPTDHNLLSFEAQTKKPSLWFWGINHQTVATSFDAQTEKPEPPVLRPNREKPSPPILRSNWRKLFQWFWGQTNDKPSQWFWGQTTDKPLTFVLSLNQDTRAPHLHVHGADRTWRHPTSRSFDHWVPDLCDHPRSSAPGILLLPRSLSLHTCRTCTPWDKQT